MTDKELHTELDNQILTYPMRVYNIMAHPHHPDPKDVDWWIDGCRAKRSNEPRTVYTQLRKQVNLIGVDCVTAEEFYMNCVAEGLLSREDLFQHLLFLKQSPSWDNCAYMSRSDCVDNMFMQNIARVCTLLNSVIDETRWDDRLSPYNYNPHFPYFVTHFTSVSLSCSDHRSHSSMSTIPSDSRMFVGFERVPLGGAGASTTRD